MAPPEACLSAALSKAKKNQSDTASEVAGNRNSDGSSDASADKATIQAGSKMATPVRRRQSNVLLTATRRDGAGDATVTVRDLSRIVLVSQSEVGPVVSESVWG